MTRRARFFGFMLLLVTALWAGGASAAPITMSPDPVSLDGLFGSFSISLAPSDDSDNVLNFDVASVSTPAVGIAAILFDGVSVLAAYETSDPDNLVRGIVFPAAGAVAGLLLDFGAPSAASFAVQTSSTPASAAIFTLTISSLPSVSQTNVWTHDYLESLTLDKQRVEFSVAGTGVIPEPHAALCYGAGLALVVAVQRRSRRAASR